MDVWDRLRWLFDTDDGGLYDIRLTGLDEAGLIAAFAFVRSRSVVTPDARFWHNGLDRDQRVADYPDAVGLVARGVAEPFHVLAPGLQFAGVVIPDLGVFVWPDEVTLDYRMGPEWGRRQLLALFELLRQLVAATGGRMGLGQHVLPAVDRLFVGEWEAYCAGYGSGA
ncbi:MAG TPA: hypothetical protein DDY78_13355 [Planctomycetales bacterium]|jgi:hypothetical protein|nr:hypothetical protein [Planctomycetales bacterium]